MKNIIILFFGLLLSQVSSAQIGKVINADTTVFVMAGQDTIFMEDRVLQFAESLNYYIYDSNISPVIYNAADSTKVKEDCKNYPLADPFYYNWTINDQIVGDFEQMNVIRIYRGNFTNNSLFPDFSNSSRMELLYFYDCTNANHVLPASWESAPYLRYFYFRTNSWDVTQVDAVINQIELYMSNGMGASYQGTKTVYLNGTGTKANATPTLATFTSNGWTLVGTNRLTKDINGRTLNVYFNP